MNVEPLLKDNVNISKICILNPDDNYDKSFYDNYYNDDYRCDDDFDPNKEKHKKLIAAKIPFSNKMLRT